MRVAKRKNLKNINIRWLQVCVLDEREGNMKELAMQQRCYKVDCRIDYPETCEDPIGSQHNIPNSYCKCAQHEDSENEFDKII